MSDNVSEDPRQYGIEWQTFFPETSSLREYFSGVFVQFSPIETRHVPELISATGDMFVIAISQIQDNVGVMKSHLLKVVRVLVTAIFLLVKPKAVERYE